MIIFLGGCFLAAFLALLVAFLVAFFRYRKTRNANWGAGAVVIGIFMILMGAITAYSFFSYAQYSGSSNSYRAEISVAGGAWHTVIVPVSMSEVVNRGLHLESGTGQFALMGSEHGRAMIVNFTSKIVITARCDNDCGSAAYHLTLGNGTDKWNPREFWVYHDSVDNKSSPTVSVCMSFFGGDYGMSEGFKGAVKPGWQLVQRGGYC